MTGLLPLDKGKANVVCEGFAVCGLAICSCNLQSNYLKFILMFCKLLRSVAKNLPQATFSAALRRRSRDAIAFIANNRYSVVSLLTSPVFKYKKITGNQSFPLFFGAGDRT